MTRKNVISRTLICLPFLAALIFIRGFHAQWIENSFVSWQLVRDAEGQVFLALDVEAPSGIRVERIRDGGRDVTDRWALINDPGWYDGQKRFPELPHFQEVLHPYLPDGKPQDGLYTTGRYTFLYEWQGPPQQRPSSATLTVRCRNLGTLNVFNAPRRPSVVIQTSLAGGRDAVFRVDLQVFFPNPEKARSLSEQDLQISLDNLRPGETPLSFTVIAPQRQEYGLEVTDQASGTRDALKGTFRTPTASAVQVFVKPRVSPDPAQAAGVRWGQIGRQLVAVLAVGYLALIGWLAGVSFCRWRGVGLVSFAEQTFVGTLLGLIMMTYVFFLVGLLGWLNWPVVAFLLVAALFVLGDPGVAAGFKPALRRSLALLKTAPWLTLPVLVLGAMVLYHIAYCFLPAMYGDGLSDIVNSYLPLLNDYVLSHSFAAGVNNSTYGILSQAFDVLRTVALMLAGEPGVYLLSVVSIVLFLGGVYLIGRDLFGVRPMLVYAALLVSLSGDLFTERFHLGKLHAAALAVFMMALAAVRYADDRKKAFLPAVFFGYLTSQYVYFVLVAGMFYFMLALTALGRHRTLRHPVFSVYLKGFLLCLFISSIFHLKLFLEVGAFLPPGNIPAWLSDVFRAWNAGNPDYKYIDNNYIRSFYLIQGLNSSGQHITWPAVAQNLRCLWQDLDFAPLLLLLPLIRRKNRTVAVYLGLCLMMVVLCTAVFVEAKRMKPFALFPLVLLQFAVVDGVLFRLKGLAARLGPAAAARLVTAAGTVLLAAAGFRLSDSSVIPRQAAFLTATVNTQYPTSRLNEAWRVFGGRMSPYGYLETIRRDAGMFVGATHPAHIDFDYGLLVRQFTSPNDTLLIVPGRFHNHTSRRMTARHALGSVIFQRSLYRIMADLKTLKIGYLSVMPIPYPDYNGYFSPLFHDSVFSKFCRVLFRYQGCSLYEIVPEDGLRDYHPSPLDMKDKMFIPMLSENSSDHP